MCSRQKFEWCNPQESNLFQRLFRPPLWPHQLELQLQLSGQTVEFRSLSTTFTESGAPITLPAAFLGFAWMAASAALHAARLSNWQRPRSPYLYLPLLHFMQGIYSFCLAGHIGVEPIHLLLNDRLAICCLNRSANVPNLVAPPGFEPRWTNYLLLTGYKSAVLPLNYRAIDTIFKHTMRIAPHYFSR